MKVHVFCPDSDPMFYFNINAQKDSEQFVLDNDPFGHCPHPLSNKEITVGCRPLAPAITIDDVTKAITGYEIPIMEVILGYFNSTAKFVAVRFDMFIRQNNSYIHGSSNDLVQS